MYHRGTLVIQLDIMTISLTLSFDLKLSIRFSRPSFQLHPGGDQLKSFFISSAPAHALLLRSMFHQSSRSEKRAAVQSQSQSKIVISINSK